MSQSVSKELACQIIIEFLKKEKNTKNRIAIIELEDDCWASEKHVPKFGVRRWPERFAVVIDLKEK